MIPVMPKAIAHPTDNRLLEKSRQHLVKLADLSEVTNLSLLGHLQRVPK